MTESRRSPPRPGSLRSFVGGVFSLLLTRAELFMLEADEQKARLLSSLLLGGLALILLLIGLMSCLLLILVVTPDASKPLVLGTICVLTLAGGAGLLLMLRQQLHRDSSPFATTLTEIRKDWDSLSGRS